MCRPHLVFFHVFKKILKRPEVLHWFILNSNSWELKRPFILYGGSILSFTDNICFSECRVTLWNNILPTRITVVCPSKRSATVWVGSIYSVIGVRRRAYLSPGSINGNTIIFYTVIWYRIAHRLFEISSLLFQSLIVSFPDRSNFS